MKADAVEDRPSPMSVRLSDLAEMAKPGITLMVVLTAGLGFLLAGGEKAFAAGADVAEFTADGAAPVISAGIRAGLESSARIKRQSVLIVDSIQTVYTGDLEGAPGNVGQVRECAARLMRFARPSLLQCLL